MKNVLPKAIDDFRVLEQLGEGAMGIVYLAEQQQPIRRQVALKVIKLGMDTKEVVARFEAERQALALMNHSNVAKVLDAGATEDGRPYFVMEAVNGIPITEYCDKYQLSIPERLKLFIDTCNGIHHAHQKGIIHRDIKPSNVLVAREDGNGVPKVIDFGVAKATNQSLTDKTLYTRHGAFIGTPEYMSPEQSESDGLDVDTGTDIYSLGVLLYEMLVGALPLEFGGLSYARRQQAIQNENPPKLTTRLNSLGNQAADIALQRQTDLRSLSKQLGGELNWITQKAIEKDRSRRYGSASELAADVQRYLNNEPIQARPQSTAYLLNKIMVRHKLPLAAAAVSVLVLTLFGVQLAIQSKRIAQEAETAQQVSAFMEGLFAVSDPGEARGNTITAREILDAGAERIETELVDQPVVQARLMHSIGNVFKGLGLYEPAASLLEHAVAVRERELGDADLELATSLDVLGEIYREQARYDEAEPLHQRALAIRQKALGPDDPAVGRSLHNLAALYTDVGRFDESETLFNRALVIQEETLGPDHPELAQTLNNLAVTYWEMGRYDEAVPQYQRALVIQEETLGPDHPDMAQTLNNLAVTYWEMGRYDEAVSQYQRALVIQEKTLGPDHPELANSLNNLANIYAVMGRHTEAEPLMQRTLAIREIALGSDHPMVGASLTNLAMLNSVIGRHAEAEPLLTRAMTISETALGPDHPETALVMTNLANTYAELQRYAEAERLFRRATTIREEVLAPDHPHVAWSLHGLANVYRNTDRLTEAEPLYIRALSIREKVGTEHPEVAWTLHDLAGLYAMQGRIADAEEAYKRTLSIRENALGANHPDVAKTLSAYGALLRDVNRNGEADALDARALLIEPKQEGRP